jgi:hypothetical protein
MAESELHRRRFPRVKSENLVLVKKVGTETFEEVTKTQVLGLGGCMIVHPEPLGEGARIEITLAVRHQVVKAVARVLYENRQPDGNYHIGVEFVQIPDADLEILKGLFTEGTILASG